MHKFIVILLLLFSVSFGQSFPQFKQFKQFKSFVKQESKYIVTDSDVITYLASLTTSLSNEQEERLDTFVLMLKDSLNITSLADSFDVMYLHANETEEAGLHNLVKRAHDGTAVNSPTFTQWEGYTGNATTMYINSNYNANTQGENYTVTDASVGAYSRKEITPANVVLFGAIVTGSSATNIIPFYSDKTYLNLNSAGTGSAVPASTTAIGFFHITTIVNKSVKLYKNTEYIDTRTFSNLNIIPNLNIYILGNNISGTANNFFSGQISFFYAGSGISSNESVRKITNCVEWYLDDLGTGVIP